MPLKSEDCRLEGYSVAWVTYWYKATHIPTGTVVELPMADGAGMEGRKRLAELLEREVLRKPTPST